MWLRTRQSLFDEGNCKVLLLPRYQPRSPGAVDLALRRRSDAVPSSAAQMRMIRRSARTAVSARDAVFGTPWRTRTLSALPTAPARGR